MTPAFRGQLHAVMLGGFCAMTSARVCDSMLPKLASELGGTVSSVAQVASSFALAYGLTQLLYGPLGDRFGKLRIIFFACMAAGLGAIACALSQSLTGLTWFRFLAGAATAGVVPLSIAWVGDSVPYEHRQAVMAKLLVGTLTGMILGQMLGGIASDTVGWRAAFWLIAVMYAFCAFRLFGQSRSAPEAKDSPTASVQSGTNDQLHWWWRSFRSYLDVVRRPMAVLVFAVVLAEGILVFSAMTFVPSFVHERDNVPLWMASLSVAGFGVGGLAYAWRSQAWLRKLGEHGFARVGATLFGLGIGFVCLLPGFLFSLVGCFAAGIGFYMLHNTLQTLGSQIHPAARGSAMALFAFSLFAGQTLGIVAAARVIAGFGYVPVLLTSAALTTGLGFFLASRLPQKKTAPNQ